ncbi:MAG: hypothetical protein N3I35_14150 [Clostridia bacterium]|nr:hypothetical protein [Clostridia bacterium]
MFSGSSKRVVVIKDIHSNLIEEAILILKSDPESGNSRRKHDAHRNVKKNNDFLLKEAELIINNYIRDNKLDMINGRDMKKKLPPQKNKRTTGMMINAVLVGSIALLLFLVSRMF